MKAKTNIIQFEAATATIEYNITETGLTELRKKCAALKASDKDAYKIVTQALSEVRSLRTGVEKRRVEYKADALEYGRRIDAEAKRVTALLVEIENPLKTEKDAWDNEQARIKLEKEKLERERIALIIERIEKIKNAPLKHQGKNCAELSYILGAFEITYMSMDQFDYGEFAPQANSAKAATSVKLKEMRDIAQEQEIETMRIAAERKQLEEEKAAWEAKKAAEIPMVPISSEMPLIVTDQQEMVPIAIIEYPISQNKLSAAIAQVEAARNPISNKDQVFIDTSKFPATLSTEKPTFPIGKPTYNELVWIIEKMLPRITAKTQSEFEFYENVKKALKLIKENQ